ncbi:signal peptidase I [Olsenella sp. KGMB02461]|nr:signal peptidase I [Olsenella sp. KGMB02461]
MPEPTKGVPQNRPWRSVLEWVFIIALAVACAMAVRAFIVEPFEVPTESMISTIQVGDRLLGEKISYLAHDPQTGDVVTFSDPENPSTTLIKRVIATPGQTIDLEDGAVYVDGVKLDEPYTQGKPTNPIERHADFLSSDITYPYTLGQDEYWMMGDNRTNSLDSRYFGPIKRQAITSRGWFIFWPLNDIGTLTDAPGKAS